MLGGMVQRAWAVVGGPGVQGLCPSYLPLDLPSVVVSPWDRMTGESMH